MFVIGMCVAALGVCVGVHAVRIASLKATVRELESIMRDTFGAPKR